jgi:hypothetical protein
MVFDLGQELITVQLKKNKANSAQEPKVDLGAGPLTSTYLVRKHILLRPGIIDISDDG